MTQNRRYGSDLTDTAVVEAATRPHPVSLTPREVGDRVTPAPAPVRVAAWVRFPETAVRVEARAIAWTPKAVHVEFTMRDGSTRRAWVWASAVERL